MKEKSTSKIARGYRLEASTHKLIKSLQVLMSANSNTVIKESCKLYYKKIIEQEISTNKEAIK